MCPCFDTKLDIHSSSSNVHILEYSCLIMIRGGASFANQLVFSDSKIRKLARGFAHDETDRVWCVHPHGLRRKGAVH